MFIKNIEVFQVQVGPLKAQEPAPIRSGFLFCGKQQSLLNLPEAK
jgi:hypothetical protein